jgi:MbtH protein
MLDINVDQSIRSSGTGGTMANPFEDEESNYRVLVNDEGQHSLWPMFIDVPGGWTVAHENDTRQACIAYIEEHWTDMRPNSLIKAMESAGDTRSVR